MRLAEAGRHPLPQSGQLGSETPLFSSRSRVSQTRWLSVTRAIPPSQPGLLTGTEPVPLTLSTSRRLPVSNQAGTASLRSAHSYRFQNSQIVVFLPTGSAMNILRLQCVRQRRVRVQLQGSPQTWWLIKTMSHHSRVCGAGVLGGSGWLCLRVRRWLSWKPGAGAQGAPEGWGTSHSRPAQGLPAQPPQCHLPGGSRAHRPGPFLHRCGQTSPTLPAPRSLGLLPRPPD